MQARPNFLAALGVALAVLSTSSFAYADATQSQSFTIWKQMDDCAKQSNKQFPDHTPEGNAKREAARLECLRAHHLPVTAANPPPAPAR
jgi:hypothetical protein